MVRYNEASPKPSTMKTYLTLFLSFFLLSVSASNLVSKILLNFETDSSSLTPEHLAFLNQHIKQLKANKQTYFVQIDGHTDTDGSRYYNEKLSMKRALSTKDFFTDNGFFSKHIYINAHAYFDSVSTNNIETGKQKNRRVEVKIYTPYSKIEQIGNHKLTTEVIQIDCSKIQEITFESGMKVIIPKNAFVDLNGDPVEGEVTLKHKSFDDYKDFVLSEIPMSFINNSTDYFSSAGMFELEAEQNEQPLRLKESKSIAVELPATSDETDTEFFVFDPEKNDWQLVNQELQKKQAKEIFRDTIMKPVYKRKLECNGYGFPIVNKIDTVFFDEANLYLMENKMLDNDLVRLAELSLELNKVNSLLSSKIYQKTKLNSYPFIDTFSDDGETFFLNISPGMRNQLSYSELKYFKGIRIEVNEANLTVLNNLGPLLDLDIISVDRKKLIISFEKENGNVEKLEFETSAKGDKNRYRKNINRLEHVFNYRKQNRENSLVKVVQKIEELTCLSEDLTNEYNMLQASLSENQECHNEFLTELCFMMTKYQNMMYKQVLSYEDKMHFYRENLEPYEFERWILSVSNSDEVIQDFRYIRQGLYCSDFSNSHKIAGMIKDVRVRKLTKTGNAYSDLVYSFNVNQMGIYNVDKLLKQRNTLIVNASEYLDENNNQIFVSNLFLVGDFMNGAINYNGAYEYTPYNFLIEKRKSYGLIAVDIKGGIYKMEESDFDKIQARGIKNCILKMKKVEDSEVDLFAMN